MPTPKPRGLLQEGKGYLEATLMVTLGSLLGPSFRPRIVRPPLGFWTGRASPPPLHIHSRTPSAQESRGQSGPLSHLSAQSSEPLSLTLHGYGGIPPTHTRCRHGGDRKDSSQVPAENYLRPHTTNSHFHTFRRRCEGLVTTHCTPGLLHPPEHQTLKLGEKTWLRFAVSLALRKEHRRHPGNVCPRITTYTRG